MAIQMSYDWPVKRMLMKPIDCNPISLMFHDTVITFMDIRSNRNISNKLSDIMSNTDIFNKLHN